MKNIYLCGDSHLANMKKASMEVTGFDALPVRFLRFGQGNVVPFAFFELDEDQQKVRITAKDWEKMEFPQHPRDVADPENNIYFVTACLNTSRFLRDYSWGKYVHWQHKEKPEQIPLSDAVIKQIIEGDSRNAVAFMKAMKSVGLNVVALDSPHFQRRDPNIQAMGFDMAFKLLKMYKSHVSEQLKAAGIPVLWVPERTYGEDGAMLPKFAHEKKRDMHHSNATFGAIMLSKIFGYCDGV